MISPTKEQLIQLAKYCNNRTGLAKAMNVNIDDLCKYIKELGISNKELVYCPKSKMLNINKEQLVAALEVCDWHQSNAARLLNSSAPTITRLIKLYNIERVCKKSIKLYEEFKLFNIPIVNTIGLSDVYLRDLIKRIEDKIDIIDDKTWICKYSTTNGYPKLGICVDGVRSSPKIHRLIYFLTKEIIPEDIQLCHIDDNKLNVHPDNLFKGSAKDNMLDKAKKFRTGSDLTSEDVLNIVEMYKTGISQKSIGKKYNKSQVQIGRILLGKSFTHIQREVFRSLTPNRSGVGKPHKMTEENVSQLRSMHKAGISKRKLSKLFGLNSKTVSDIISGNIWKPILD
jgi:hypothetical protein